VGWAWKVVQSTLKYSELPLLSQILGNRWGGVCECRTRPSATPVNSSSLVTLTATAGFSSIAESEDALLRHLFQGYQKWVRPVLNSNDTIKVYFGLKLSQLVDVVSNSWH
jgi:hypothetical protein